MEKKTTTVRPSVAGAFGKKRQIVKKEREKKKGIEVPPAVYRPLIGEDGKSQIKDAVLQFVLGVTSALPESSLPEFAFAGKSNVGKSSLLNALVNRKALARTSSQPGKTQTINFYRVNGAVYFVDLPGYGYASASEAAKASWGKMIERYLHEDKQLRAVFLLLDLRHAPSENDILMYNWILEQGLPAVLVGTKADKLQSRGSNSLRSRRYTRSGCRGKFRQISAACASSGTLSSRERRAVLPSLSSQRTRYSLVSVRRYSARTLRSFSMRSILSERKRSISSQISRERRFPKKERVSSPSGEAV